MNAIYTNNEKPTDLNNLFEQINNDSDIQSGLLFIADKNSPDPDTLTSLLVNCSKNIIGGIFPEIIHNGTRKSEGTLFIPLKHKLKTVLFNLGDDTDSFFTELDTQFLDFNAQGTLMVFCDALGKNKVEFIESLFNYFGVNLTYLGGGAGSLKFQSFPCIIDNTGIHQNSGVIALLPDVKKIGVAHGWNQISEPLKVTQASGTTVQSLDWEPAFSLYKKIVESHSGATFNNENFFDIAKSYPLGISKMDAEMVIRDPYMIQDNNIHVVDLVEQGEHIRIMHGNLTSLLGGAEKARDQAFLNASPDETEVFCVDCISRVLYMQDDIEKELSIIQKDGTLNGILSIGEIANSGESFLEIYNKTVVVVKW
jgi:hypothetical protein